MATVKTLFLLLSASRDGAKAALATKKGSWGRSVFSQQVLLVPKCVGSAQWLFSIDWPRRLQFPW